ncbi:glycosyltransferase family protein [Candidatus Laterigemmans baculatus]|uniref:glycosyltransferase family protein n=1 Tax=Candidatus Laterigemmans baculatus TaxID=2770505 RepID=UPI0013DBED5F|nr:glycosyltransferase [Candidatus Laterigemmans baculatus]
MLLPDAVKQWAGHQPWIDAGWSYYRRQQLHRSFRQRQAEYARRAEAAGLRYDPLSTAKDVQRRLAGRGYQPTAKASGEIHTFAFIPRLGWHSALYPDLQALGRVSEYDYAARGYTPEEFRKRDASAVRRRRSMHREFIETLARVHAEDPVDWVFVYASGLEVTPELIEEITQQIGVPVVNMCLDDKQSWEAPGMDGWRFGQIDLAPAFDLSWTSARVACEWYLCEGGRPIYQAEGFDAEFFRPMSVKKDIPVSFVGGAYGFRRSLIRDLRRCNIPLQVFGHGWGSDSLSGRELVRLINRSQINLGAGGILYSEMLTNLKGRDFEVPGTGGGLYLTTYNADLADHFEIGREIACYHSREELVDLVRHYLRNPEEAEAIAARARVRCLREHRWLHRYETICRTLGVMASAKTMPSSQHSSELTPAAA